MRAPIIASLILFTSLSTAALAAEFDGSVPLSCKAEQANDCLPTSGKCSKMKPESDIPPIFAVDFAKKEIRSPFRTSLLPVAHSTTNSDSLVLQGADKLFAWSALIDRKTGALTVTVADSKGAYVVFGSCKVASP